jgi:putative sterol carrier protein
MTDHRYDGTPTPQAIFDALPERFLPEVAGRTKATVQIELTGDGGGQWWVKIAGGSCTTGTGPVAKPDVTLSSTVADYVKIRLGELDPLAATMAGQLKVEGRYGIAVKFAKMFRTGA